MSQELTAIFNLNSHVLWLRGLRNISTGDPISSGVTVAAKLCPAGTSTAVDHGEIAALAPIVDHDGDWSGVFGANAAVSLGIKYDVIVTVDGGAHLTARWIIHCKVVERVVG